MLAAAFGHHGEPRDADRVVDLQREGDDAVARLREADALLGGAQGDRPVDGHRHLHVAHAVFHGEHRHGQLELLLGTQHPRQRREEHEGLAHRHLLARRSEGSVAAGDDHHPDLTDVGGQLDVVAGLFAGVEAEGAEDPHHGGEAVGLGGRCLVGLAVTADADQLLERARAAPRDEGEGVPGAHA